MVTIFSDGDIAYQVTPTIADFSYVEEIKPSSYDLVFKAENIPPLGLKLYYIESTQTKLKNLVQKVDKNGKADEDGTVYVGTSVSSQFLNYLFGDL